MGRRRVRRCLTFGRICVVADAFPLHIAEATFSVGPLLHCLDKILELFTGFIIDALIVNQRTEQLEFLSSLTNAHLDTLQAVLNETGFRLL